MLISSKSSTLTFAASAVALLVLASDSQAQGRALRFDGVDDFCTISDQADHFDLGRNMTIEAWVRLDAPNSNVGIVTGGSGAHYGLTANASTPSMRIETPNTSTVSATNSLPVGEWTHLAGTFGSDTITL